MLLKTQPRDPRGWICKLSDFGCVRMLKPPAEEPGTGNSTSTGTGTAAAGAPAATFPHFTVTRALGTLTHMAPEVISKGALLTASVDIYSFGIMMAELVRGWEMGRMRVRTACAFKCLPYVCTSIEKGVRHAYTVRKFNVTCKPVCSPRRDSCSQSPTAPGFGLVWAGIFNPPPRRLRLQSSVHPVPLLQTPVQPPLLPLLLHVRRRACR